MYSGVLAAQSVSMAHIGETGIHVVPEPKVLFEYRVSWESPPPPVVVYDWEQVHGRDVWPTLSDEQWEALPWKPSERVAEDYEDVHAQYVQLQTWEQTHQQPIRNVKIQQRQRFTPTRWVDSR